MRRPLDWIVVSISLLVLFANRMLTAKPPELQVAVPDIEAVVSNAPAAEPASPFAWIQEDRSQVFLPAATPRLAGPVTSQHNPALNALYTWSSPLVATDKASISFQ